MIRATMRIGRLEQARRMVAPLTFLASALVLSLFTVHVQVSQLGLKFLEQGLQIQWHRAVLEGTSTDPWQYRVFSELLVEAVIRIFRHLGLPHAAATAFILVRIAQNVLLFILAASYFRELGIDTYRALLGISLLAWGISYSYYHATLQFNIYFDLIFYLWAAMVALRRRYLWIIPITALAALNRETSGFIPLFPLAEYVSQRRRGPPRPELLYVGLVSASLFAAVFVGLRWFYGPRPMIPNPTFGLGFLAYNVTNVMSWVNLFATLGLLPLMAFWSIRRWPRFLTRVFWLMVPLWFVIHFCSSLADEPAHYLVPHVLVFIPGALSGISAGPPRSESSVALGEDPSGVAAGEAP